MAILRRKRQAGEAETTSICRFASGAAAHVLSGFCGTAEEVAGKLSKHGHSEEAKTMKNLHLADS